MDVTARQHSDGMLPPSDREMASGFGFSGATYAARAATQFAISVVMARVLAPGAFGLVAMILVFSQLAIQITDAGFRTALIQRRELSSSHLATAYWASLLVGATLCATLWVTAPALVLLFGNQELVPLARVVAFSFPIASLGIVPSALLGRRLATGRIGSAEIAGTVAGGGAGLALALNGAGVWSLVVQILVQCAIEVLALTALARWRPPLRWSGQALRDLTPVSMNYLGFSVFNYVVRNLDNLLIGRYAGAQSLGLYSRAYGLMLLPATHLSRVLSRVMFPSLARLQQDHARARAVYLRAQQTIALISFPLSIGLLVTAEEFVQVLYGEPWRDTAPILRVLSMVGLMQSIGSTTGWIYQSQGRTDVMLRWSLLSALPTIPAFLVGIRWGAFGVAVAYLVRGLLLVYPNHAVPGKLIGLHFTDTVRALGGVLFCAVLMGLGAWAAGVYWKPTSAGGMLATRTTCGVLLYVGALFALRPTGFLVALNWLRARTTMES